MVNTPRYIVIHTAAAERAGITADEIRNWHLARGWTDIGYHYVIEDDGVGACGRAEVASGAHARGLNSQSIGICVTGHGDFFPFNKAQIESLCDLCLDIMDRYGIPIDHVIGHREIGRTGAPDPHKTCPGTKVDMDFIRAEIEAARGEI